MATCSGYKYGTNSENINPAISESFTLNTQLKSGYEFRGIAFHNRLNNSKRKNLSLLGNSSSS